MQQATLPPPAPPGPPNLALLYLEYERHRARHRTAPLETADAGPGHPLPAPAAGTAEGAPRPPRPLPPPDLRSEQQTAGRAGVLGGPPLPPPQPPSGAAGTAGTVDQALQELRTERATGDPTAAAIDELTGGFGRLVADALERAVPSSGRVLQPHQIPPREHDDPTSSVKGWVMMAGRNAGKSYAGARWMHRVCSVPGKPKRARIIAPSFGDAVASCVEGPSGILEASNRQAVWKPSHPGGAQIQWPNGSVCYVIGTPTPRDVDRLRAVGNIDYDWFEEAAANPQLKEAERQARLSRRRLGSKWICTTTPKPLPEIRAWQKDPTVRISEATAYDNPYADPLWLEELETMYAGTALYKQEVLGKVLEDVAGALWNASMIERSRIRSLDEAEAQGYELQRVAVGVDPANSSGLTGIVAVALALLPSPFAALGGRPSRHLLVLEDCSTPGASAEAWAAEAVRLALKYDAVIVAENDSGGDAIRAVLKGADHLDRVTVTTARARGVGSKQVRAEPVAILWERDDYRAHMVGADMALLEEQMTTWVPDDKKTAGPTGSPDRVDAMVWACTHLWNRATAGDIEVHLPSHAREAAAAALVRDAISNDAARRAAELSQPGSHMTPWSRSRGSRRHRKNPARSDAA